MLTARDLFVFLALAGTRLAYSAAEPDRAAAPAASPTVVVPGAVIDHSPASSGEYIGSPSIVILSNGTYVASHDFFGPRAGNHRSVVFQSSDRGASWKKVSEIEDAFWCSLFLHRNALYFIGTTREYGNLVIRRSDDTGRTWSSPADDRTGLLRNDGNYHCAPVPVIVHNGRIWRAFEHRVPAQGWGVNFRAFVMSAPVGSDLLAATNWAFSNELTSNTNWLAGTFGGWLEGNVVVTREGRLLDILRVDTAGYPEKAAIVSISSNGLTASFDPTHGFIDFPGGAKKFAIRYDAPTDLYWSVATFVPEPRPPRIRPASVRNTLGLMSSPDLTNWTMRTILLSHPDVRQHGFQYVDWQFDGEDLIAACRIAYDDGLGGAHNNHDANFLTFHRIAKFRSIPIKKVSD